MPKELMVAAKAQKVLHSRWNAHDIYSNFRHRSSAYNESDNFCALKYTCGHVNAEQHVAVAVNEPVLNQHANEWMKFET